MHNPSLKFFCSLHNHINCFLCIKNLTFPSFPFSSHPSLLPPLSSSIIFLLLFLCLLPFFLTALLHHSFLSSLTSPLFPPSLQQQPKGRPLFLSFSTPLLLFYRRNNMSGLYTPHSFSPARTLSPQIRGTPEVDSQYLAELLAEHQKLGPFVQVLPICSRLLNQEILRVSGMVSNQGFGEFDRLQFRSPSPMSSANIVSNISGTGLGGWNGLAQERPSVPPGMTMDWHSAPASPSSYIVKKILRLEVPVDTYPNFNFVGRLLGPRGNSLKRVEASTGCRVYIRGKGSIKDPGKEDKLRGRPGYEHLNDPLHVLIEAELPVNVVDARLRQAQEIIEELLKPVLMYPSEPLTN